LFIIVQNTTSTVTTAIRHHFVSFVAVGVSRWVLYYIILYCIIPVPAPDC
jgi:hypothetical protein